MMGIFAIERFQRVSQALCYFTPTVSTTFCTSSFLDYYLYFIRQWFFLSKKKLFKEKK